MKKNYETPSIQIIEVESKSAILAGSEGITATRQSYSLTNDTEWED